MLWWPTTWLLFSICKFVCIIYMFWFICGDFKRRLYSDKIHFYVSLAINVVFVSEVIFNLTIFIILANMPCSKETEHCPLGLSGLVYIGLFIIDGFSILTSGIFSLYVYNVQKVLNIQQIRDLSLIHI